MNKVIPIVTREQIMARQANPQRDQLGRARIAQVNARLAKHTPRMNQLADQAIRAQSATTKVALLREITQYLHDAAMAVAPCKKGCSHCCHIAVTVPVDEATVIGREIGVKPRAVDKPAMLGRAGREEQDWKWFGKPCVFLKDGACSIYASRPLACRTHFSLEDDDVMCRMAEDHDPTSGVLYLDHKPYTNVISAAFIRTWDHFADIREYFPSGKGSRK